MATLARCRYQQMYSKACLHQRVGYLKLNAPRAPKMALHCSKPLIGRAQSERHELVSSGSQEMSCKSLVTPRTVTGTVAGAAALVTGSTVGAGVLAMPQATQAAGLGPSIILLLGVWGCLASTALLLAETNLECHKRLESELGPEAADRVIPLSEMAGMTIGPAGSSLVSSVYVVLAFTLVLAYDAKAGTILNPMLQSMLHTDAALGSVLFAGSIGSVLLFGGTTAAEKVNSALTVALLLCFCGILANGATSSDISSALEHSDWSQAASCLPIMYMSLVYHDLVPVICHLLGFDRKKSCQALILGSLVPLMMFMAWETVCMCAAPPSGVPSDPLQVLIETQGNLGGFITAFSLAALSTSAIGTGLSLTSYFQNTLPHPSTLLNTVSQTDKPANQLPEALNSNRVAAVVLAFAPSAYMSLSNPDSFMTASHFAGAYGMTLLYGLLPPVMAWCARSNRQIVHLLPQGQLALAALIGVGLAVEGLQLAGDLHIEPGTAADVISTGLVDMSTDATFNPMYELASVSSEVTNSVLHSMDSANGFFHSAFLMHLAY